MFSQYSATPTETSRGYRPSVGSPPALYQPLVSRVLAIKAKYFPRLYHPCGRCRQGSFLLIPGARKLGKLLQMVINRRRMPLSTLACWTGANTLRTISQGTRTPCAPLDHQFLRSVCSNIAVPLAMAFLALVLAILGLKAGGTSASAAFQHQCTAFDLSSVGLTNATVTEHVYVESGTNLSLPDNDPSCNSKSQVVPVNLCRVALQIATSESSGIVAEIWLPEDWNGRLVTTGNGGLGGCKVVLFSSQANTPD